MNRRRQSFRTNGSGLSIHRMAVSLAGVGFALITLLALLPAPAEAQRVIPPIQGQPFQLKPRPDFNGDNYADLAIGAPEESYTWQGRNIQFAGVVHVVYGSPGGLAIGTNQLFSRRGEPAGSLFPPAYANGFGRALAWGDFNRDGFDDLAIGVSGDKSGEGTVEVYHGSRAGLASQPAQRLTRTQMSAPLPSAGDGTAQFGSRLAAGDANGDGFSDLAITQVLGAGYRGGVYVVPGSAAGLNPAASQTKSNAGMGPSTLAFGDFNGDGCFDLAMGHPYNYVNDRYAGEVRIAFGTPYGLDALLQSWSQDSPNIAGICEDFDYFGTSLVAADFNRDGKWDLAIGAPGENSNNGHDDGEGVVHVLFGQANGLSAGGSQIWSQLNDGVYDNPESEDRFGEALAAMDVDSDGYPELVVGIPGENAGKGGIQVLTIVAGPLGIRHAFWNQDSYQVLGAAEAEDRFGAALSVGDYNGDGRLDLTIGVPGENRTNGGVNVLYGASSGLSWPGNQRLAQGLNGMQENEEPGDFFGRVL